GQSTFNKRMYFGQPFAILTSVLPTDSCYYATGVITDTTNSAYKLGNIFVKFDLNGDTVFTKKLLSPHKYYETWRGDLINTPDGALADVGITTDTALKAILIKYNLNGDTIFTREYFNPYFPQESFIATVAFASLPENGFYFVCGIDPSIDDSEGDIMVLKLDSVGNVLQEKVYGNSTTEIGGALIVEDDRGVIIGACRTNTNQVLNNFFRRTYIFKTDSLGNVVWEFLSSPPNFIQDTARGMVKSTDGGLVVGTSRGFEDPVNAEVGIIVWESAYFFKLDENQEVVWELEVFDSISASPGNSLDRLIAVDSGMAYVAAGDFIFIKSLDPPDGGRYGWVMKVSDEGNLLWIRKYNIAESVGHSHQIYDLKQTPDGGFILVGKAVGAAPVGEPSGQAWLLKLDSCGCHIPGCQWQDTVTVVRQPEEASVGLAIHPNPTRDYLNFQLRTPRYIPSAAFRILNTEGRVMKEFKSDYVKDTFIVPVWDWPAGVYFLQVEAGGHVLKTEKFVVQK
ncbi:MAG: T9SS type A sorting domain-containing protein, partial [Saprospiraceae bacterium]